MESRLDVAQPLLPQLLTSNITAKEYDEWIHCPANSIILRQRSEQMELCPKAEKNEATDNKRITISSNSVKQLPAGAGVSLRFFSQPFLELQTRCPWWLVPTIWIPVACLLFYFFPLPCLKGACSDIGPLQTAFFLMLGPLFWGFFEYILHRFLFHAVPHSKYARAAHFIMHGNHHLQPNDSLRLVFPPFGAFLLMIPIFFSVSPLLGNLRSIFLFTTGLPAYVCYDLTHWSLHHVKVPAIPPLIELAARPKNDGPSALYPFLILRMLWYRQVLRVVSWFSAFKAMHISHHYGGPGGRAKNFGISPFGKIFDFVFGTNQTPASWNRRKNVNAAAPIYVKETPD